MQEFKKLENITNILEDACKPKRLIYSKKKHNATKIDMSNDLISFCHI